jgi:hypothetical protein
MFRLTKKNQITSEIEVIDINTNKSLLNQDLIEIRDMECTCSIYGQIGVSPLLSNSHGLSFCTSRGKEHYVYQVEEYNPTFDDLSDAFCPSNQNFKLN